MTRTFLLQLSDHKSIGVDLEKSDSIARVSTQKYKGAVYENYKCMQKLLDQDPLCATST